MLQYIIKCYTPYHVWDLPDDYWVALDYSWSRVGEFRVVLASSCGDPRQGWVRRVLKRRILERGASTWGPMDPGQHLEKYGNAIWWQRTLYLCLRTAGRSRGRLGRTDGRSDGRIAHYIRIYYTLVYNTSHYIGLCHRKQYITLYITLYF